jgi:hypothetical protein
MAPNTSSCAWIVGSSDTPGLLMVEAALIEAAVMKRYGFALSIA